MGLKNKAVKVNGLKAFYPNKLWQREDETDVEFLERVREKYIISKRRDR